MLFVEFEFIRGFSVIAITKAMLTDIISVNNMKKKATGPRVFAIGKMNIKNLIKLLILWQLRTSPHAATLHFQFSGVF